MQNATAKLLLRYDRQRFYFSIPMGRTLIGRISRCGLMLGNQDKQVSRDHAELRRTNRELLVRDLGSRNGTFVNEIDIRNHGSVALRVGDRLRICNYEAVVTDRRVPFEDSGLCMVQDHAPLSDSSGRTLSTLGHQDDSSSGDFRPTSVHRRFAALVEVGKRLGEVTQSEQMLEKALASVLEIFPTAERCVIGFADDNQRFVPRWWTLRSGDRHSEIRVSQHIFERVTRSGHSILFADVMSDFEDEVSVLAAPLRSVMCSPLLDPEGQVVGMIQADADAVEKFDASDLDVFATVATQISLALNFAQLHSKTLEDAIIRKDIEQARSVQLQFLPSAPPVVAGYEFADYYSPARHVGGDYYDYIPLSNGQLAVVLGDVVGKGVPAALTMVKLATEAVAAFEITTDPAKAMTRLNRRLVDSFITCVILVLDPQSHQVTVATAGHELPLLQTAQGQINRIGNETSGLPLSVLEDFVYDSETLVLAPGDRILVYSDGFADAETPDGSRRFGKEQIMATMAEHRGSAIELARSLVEQVDTFTSGSPQFDDMCLVCMRRAES